MTAKVLPRYKRSISRYVLIPSTGGCFELTVDGKLVYSKLRMGSFPNEADVLKQLDAILGQ